MAKWIIHQMDKAADGLVLRVRYRVEGPDQQFYQTHAAQQSLERGKEMIPFEKLTEAVVVGWVKAILGPEEVALIEAMVDERLVYIPPEGVTVAPPWA